MSVYWASTSPTLRSSACADKSVNALGNYTDTVYSYIFQNNKRYTLVIMYSSPSELLPLSILNHFYQYNLNLILIGNLNAQHSHWYDVNPNPKGCQLNEWICDKENLRICNIPQPTSLRYHAILDLVLHPLQLSSEWTETDRMMQVTDHYPVRCDISSFKLFNANWYQATKMNWNLINCILDLKQNNFSMLGEHFLGSLEERCTKYYIIRQDLANIKNCFIV